MAATDDDVVTVLFFPGRGKTLKSYQCHFRHLCLTRDPTSGARVILCHSRGVDAARAHPGDLPIVAMDPSDFRADDSDRRRMCAFVNATRDWPATDNFLRLTRYTPDTHYPYMVARVRDAIERECVRVASVCAQ